MVQFRRSGDELHSHVVMRSSDAWLGLPYDVFVFSMLQHYIAAYLGPTVAPGKLTYTLMNGHIYEPHWQIARTLVDDFYEEYKEVPEQPRLVFSSADAVFERLKLCGDAEKPLRTWKGQ